MVQPRVRNLLISVGAAALMTVTGPAFAHPVPAAETSEATASDVAAAGFWSCSLLPGYTFTNTRRTTRCSTSGLRTQYYVQRPSDRLWACTVPSGFVYDSVQSTTRCSISGLRTQYRVRKPRTGLWACTVPPGYTYTATQRTTRCSVTGLRTKYRLRAY
ncbi:hypothetical protein [Streptomyces halobius]|uniref:Ig-like domain-containing protein n=1 Tax=Streptomyces halobius TaxID=2879846 RepID=A0ABY4M0B6_9ACTN|nr:hypothetical protein [Streptomyces halobius]UQA90568.1 hypothetical protein K9S39_00415 [Streptomyces halobius]